HRAGDDAAAGDHRIDGHAPSPLLVEDELGRRLMHLISPDGPVLVVDVELGPDVDQLDVLLVVRVDRTYVTPVALRARLDVLERIREYLQGRAQSLRDDVLAEVVGGSIIGRILLQETLQE